VTTFVGSKSQHCVERRAQRLSDSPSEGKVIAKSNQEWSGSAEAIRSHQRELMRGSVGLILGGILVAKPTAGGSTDHETDRSGYQGPNDRDNGSRTNRFADHG